MMCNNPSVVAKRAGRHIGILGDLQGPKIRINCFKKGYVRLDEGQSFALDSKIDPLAGNEKEVGVAYEQHAQDVRADGRRHGAPDAAGAAPLQARRRVVRLPSRFGACMCDASAITEAHFTGGAWAGSGRHPVRSAG